VVSEVLFSARARHRTQLLRLGAVTVFGIAACASLVSACATAHNGKAPVHQPASAASPTVSGPIHQPASAASPTVSGPATGGMGAIVPANLTSPDPSKLGYQSAEYFLAGSANAYTSESVPSSDGKWTVTPTSPASYKTRIVVFRPSNPAKFNGTVVVEWLNVSGQLDSNPDWTMTHNELIREGAAWVGVSAQAVGVSQLQCSATAPPTAQCATKGDPARYGSLVHPGDNYSYDIFSQAGQAIRDNPAKILGGLKPSTLLAAGESQSAGRMVTYIDAVQPLVHEYDGFLVHSRSANGAPLSVAPLTPLAAPTPTLIRTDLDVPVFVFQTETDIGPFGGFQARQPDTDGFRQWEAAGTSHFDTYGLHIGPTDIGDGQGAVANLEAMQHPSTSPGQGAECAKPINTGGAHWLLNAAIYWLNQWATKGTPPPVGQPLQIATVKPFTFAKDRNGNTLGGVRTPQVDAPIATLGTDNTAAPGNTSLIARFCFLFGSTVPFTPTQLTTLYKNHDQFVSTWSQATKNLVNKGFILKSDENELTQSAAHAQIGN
jgi:Alpha/beta hydrolase domain